MINIVKEKYEDMLDFRLNKLKKNKKAAREASSFYIVSSNQDRKILKYDSFKLIPIDIRNDEKNYEILKIRYELQENRDQKSNMFAPRITWRSGYSYYEKLIYNVLIKRGYYENKDFEHLYPIENKSYIEGRAYLLDFAFVKEKLDVECDGEPWHEKCRNHKEELIRDNFLKNNGWKILRFNFTNEDLRKVLAKVISQINKFITKIRNQ